MKGHRMATPHTGTILDADVVYLKRQVELIIARHPRGGADVVIPAWLAMRLLEIYEQHRRYCDQEAGQ